VLPTLQQQLLLQLRQVQLHQDLERVRAVGVSLVPVPVLLVLAPKMLALVGLLVTIGHLYQVLLDHNNHLSRSRRIYNGPRHTCRYNMGQSILTSPDNGVHQDSPCTTLMQPSSSEGRKHLMPRLQKRNQRMELRLEDLESPLTDALPLEGAVKENCLASNEVRPAWPE